MSLLQPLHFQVLYQHAPVCWTSSYNAAAQSTIQSNLSILSDVELIQFSWARGNQTFLPIFLQNDLHNMLKNAQNLPWNSDCAKDIDIPLLPSNHDLYRIEYSISTSLSVSWCLSSARIKQLPIWNTAGNLWNLCQLYPKKFISPSLKTSRLEITPIYTAKVVNLD